MMLMKQIGCSTCNGVGCYTQWQDDTTVSAIFCKTCNGTGVIEVPMTNYDMIKQMNKEQLAKLLSINKCALICPNKLSLAACTTDLCNKKTLDWLDQIVEDIL